MTEMKIGVAVADGLGVVREGCTATVSDETAGLLRLDVLHAEVESTNATAI